LKTILLTGKDGQVGWELQRALAPLGRVVALGRPELDLGDTGAIRARVREVKPEIIVNAAAYTGVDKAESEPELAMAINGTAPGILAEEAVALNALLIHYSTDYVFDGTKSGPYVEDDAPNPINVYGRTKLAGERAIEQVGGTYFIFRTSWVYSPRGKNFLLTILRLARERDELRIVDDQVGAPTTARVIADTSAQVLGRLCPGHSSPAAQRSGGIYNLTCAGSTSWFGFAKQIIELRGSRPGSRRPNLIPIRTDQYPLPAKRPANSVLEGGKLRAAFGLHPPGWESALGLCLEEITD
jgi:dTDP-4-dehydrorhamnose reductase